jgi:trimeric autotransporter adhesin
MNRSLLVAFTALLFTTKLSAQNVGLNSTGAAANLSAALDIDVSGLGTKRGLLIPRMSLSDRNAMNPLPAAAQGLMIYQTDGVEGFYYNTSSTTTPNWIYLAGGTLAGSGTATQVAFWSGANTLSSNSDLYWDNTNSRLGIGTSVPEFMLSTDVDGGILAKGTFGSGTLLSTAGAGTRMIWYPRKGSFRAGTVSGAIWDANKIGDYSTAFGKDAEASGNYSFAAGWTPIAIGTGSVALGGAAQATGSGSIAIGYSAWANASNNTIAVGNFVTASGENAVAMGNNTTSPSYNEFVVGSYNTSYVPLGINAWNTADRMFVVGNGSDAGTLSNAMVILKNGNTGIGTSVPLDKLHVVGKIRMVDGNQAPNRVLVSDANGTATWTDAGGLPVKWSSILAPTANLSLAHGANTTSFTFDGITNTTALTLSSSTVTSGALLNLTKTSTAGTGSGSSSLLNILSSGANANSNHSVFGINAVVSNTGTSAQNSAGIFTATGNGLNQGVMGIANGAGTNNYGGVFSANSASGNNTAVDATANGSATLSIGVNAKNSASAGNKYAVSGTTTGLGTTNIGGYFTASGGTANYAGIFDLGNVGIGTTAPLDKLHVVGKIRMVDGNQAVNRVMVSDLNGTATWTDPGGLGVKWSSILAPTANLVLAHGANTTSFSFDGVTNGSAFTLSSSTLTTGTLLNLTNTSTAGGGAGNAIGLNISISGANVNNNHSSTGINSIVSNTGITAQNFGGNFSANGGTINEAVHAATSTDAGIGLRGINNSTGTSTQRGVVGEKMGNTVTGSGWAVWGNATGSGSQNGGGFFSSTGATINMGVYATSTGAATTNYGGWFEGQTGATTTTYGVFAQAAGTPSTTSYGVYAANVATTGTKYGVYGTVAAVGTSNIGGYFSATGGTTNYAAIFNAGNVGIGCTSPAYKLHVVGDIAAQGGTLRAASAVVSTTISACSDIRFKKDILPLTSALANVMKLQGVTYYWKVKEFPDRYFNDRKQIGIIAQEIEKVYPELVQTDKDGYKSVDYSKLTPILLEAIKDQQKEIDSLNARMKKIEELLTKDK